MDMLVLHAYSMGIVARFEAKDDDDCRKPYAESQGYENFKDFLSDFPLTVSNLLLVKVH